jgi:hypothetical protein
MGPRPVAQAPQTHVMGQQFLEAEALTGRMRAGQQAGGIDLGRRAVDRRQGAVQRRQARRHLRANGIGQAVAALQAGQRLFGRAPQGGLAEAGRCRVDGRQRRLQRRGRVGGHDAVLRVRDLEAAGAVANLAVEPQPRPGLQLRLLALAEVEPAQRERAGAIDDAGHERAPAPMHHLGMLDRGVDDGLVAHAQLADGAHARAVLVAQRQMEQDIRHRGDTEAGEKLALALAHPRQRGHRGRLRRGHRARSGVTRRG